MSTLIEWLVLGIVYSEVYVFVFMFYVYVLVGTPISLIILDSFFKPFFVT